MSKKSDLIFVEHVLESIEAIEEFSKEMTKEKLAVNRLNRNAIIRELEIIGEAVKNISDTTKERYKSVLWREIAGTRDKMIHHYFGIDLEIVWDIIKIELPILKKEMLKIKEEMIDSK